MLKAGFATPSCARAGRGRSAAPTIGPSMPGSTVLATGHRNHAIPYGGRAGRGLPDRAPMDTDVVIAGAGIAGCTAAIPHGRLPGGSCSSRALQRDDREDALRALHPAGTEPTLHGWGCGPDAR
ncbi:hypothetical protein HBB16_19560 [Pseudonocardia sp. MCCB 268]|nr:hypothetical protein [Pseudonocardia cytotoxica]